MKKIVNSVIVLWIALFSSTSSEEESVYESVNSNCNAVKTKDVVIIRRDLNDVTSYNELIVMRSDQPLGIFRNVKELAKDAILVLS